MTRGRPPLVARPDPGAERERAAGLLLHVTSLPSPGPIGDLGPAAYQLLDWLVEAGLSRWQILPVGPTGFGDSPYGALSSFAGNPLLVSPEALAAEGLVEPEAIDLAPADDPARVDFAAARASRERLLRRVWDSAAWRSGALSPAWESFRDARRVRGWLDDWALFAALKRAHEGRPWWRWDSALRDRDGAALVRARRELAAEIELQSFEQFLFFHQWFALRAAAGARGVRLIGDLPIYPARDSCDVWARRALFDLDEEGRPRHAAGVPPDYFSETGQLWGNPLYRWDRHRQDGFRWWIERVRWQLELFHVLRLDHFRGFVDYWRVPAGDETAAGGRWVRGPGRALFVALERALGPLPFLAEDLGEIDEPVHALRRRLGLPGMRVLQFGFEETDSLHAPHRHPPDAVAYTGTHDNDTTSGWLDKASEDTRHRAFLYLGVDAERLPWAMVRAALTSVADLAMVPLQDLLELGSEARMNQPARESGNWSWRTVPGQLPSDLADRVRDLVGAAARTPVSPGPSALSSEGR